jgi:hypothetical protein
MRRVVLHVGFHGGWILERICRIGSVGIVVKFLCQWVYERRTTSRYSQGHEYVLFLSVTDGRRSGSDQVWICERWQYMFDYLYVSIFRMLSKVFVLGVWWW